MTTLAPPGHVRVAIYCRKSVTEGLEQEFNSLDAQRQACEAYVRSQRGEGWLALDTRYDDGGFSGSTIQRPAFQALLRDVERGAIDAIAVYKIDRLSRSLRDFAKLIELFERHGVTFVSVTQQFSTATSMGRLTLNMLMSFAEYEREIIGERIRDKKRATRSRGMWVGGKAMLGYDVVDKKLVVNDDEATQVREMFELYLQSNSLRDAVAELRRRGWISKSLVTRHDRRIHGKPFSRSTLHSVLTNDVYRGKVRCADGLVAGVHEPIIGSELWEAVQARLRLQAQNGGAATRNKTGALLRGLVHCGRCHSPMLHTFSTKNGRRFRYYVCSRLHNEGAETCPSARVAAGKFERFIVEQVLVIGTDDALIAKTAAAAEHLANERQEHISAELRRLDRQRRATTDELRGNEIAKRRDELTAELEAIGDGTVDADDLRVALAGFVPVWEHLFAAERERILRLLVERITYQPDGGDVEIALRACGIKALVKEAQEAT
jgi:site-specific DNA recombinase